jgi:Ni/Co efflux regulator RcnB
MKKLVIGALAALTLGAPALASADTLVRYDHGRAVQTIRVPDRRVIVAPRTVTRIEYRGWRTGQRFDRYHAPNYRMIGQPGHYRLRQAPRGYYWAQSGRDAVLVALSTGLIAQVLANHF